jgi:hypothetical protein
MSVFGSVAKLNKNRVVDGYPVKNFNELDFYGTCLRECIFLKQSKSHTNILYRRGSVLEIKPSQNFQIG